MGVENWGVFLYDDWYFDLPLMRMVYTKNMKEKIDRRGLKAIA